MSFIQLIFVLFSSLFDHPFIQLIFVLFRKELKKPCLILDKWYESDEFIKGINFNCVTFIVFKCLRLKHIRWV